jgi:hypothetical protein
MMLDACALLDHAIASRRSALPFCTRMPSVPSFQPSASSMAAAAAGSASSQPAGA